jgi:hypothetical protein
MPSKGKQIMEGMASLVTSAPSKKTPKPLVEQMAENANPDKRKAAADSLKKAFGG